MTADRDYLFWLKERLIHQYGENPNTDFVLKLGYIAAATPPKVDTWTEPKGRYHVLGETSTEGPRWQIWDDELKRTVIAHISDVSTAHQAVVLMNQHDKLYRRLRDKTDGEPV